MSNNNVVPLRPKLQKILAVNKQILEAGKKEIDLALALLVGRNGGKKVVLIEPENGDGCGVDTICEFVEESQSLLKPEEKLMVVHLKRLKYQDLERLADQVRIIDQ